MYVNAVFRINREVATTVTINFISWKYLDRIYTQERFLVVQKPLCTQLLNHK